jgi:hypothetical protein
MVMKVAPFFIPGLPQLPVNTDPKIEPDLRDVYNAIRNLAKQIGQYGGFETSDETYQVYTQAAYTAGFYKRRVYAQAIAAMPAGAAVALVMSGGLKARFANASVTATPCYGFNNTPGTCAIGDTIEIALPGCVLTTVGGLTPGERYFLHTVDGIIALAPSATPGFIRQAVGFALDVDRLYFWPNVDWTVI